MEPRETDHIQRMEKIVDEQRREVLDETKALVPAPEDETEEQREIREFITWLDRFATTLSLPESPDMFVIRTTDTTETDEGERIQIRNRYRAALEEAVNAVSDGVVFRQAQLGLLVRCAALKVQHGEYNAAYEDMEEALQMAQQDPEAFDEATIKELDAMLSSM
ncbi:MAG TPA: hypothetical protein VGE59_04455 [Patescibacteria group bacterium]